MTDDAHVFGGPWTERKLAILGKYLSRYTTALKNQKFKRGYIDAFAGTGHREGTATAKAEESERLLLEGGVAQSTLPDILEPPEPLERFLDGSARVALQCDPKFDSYVFIEKSLARCRELECLKIDFPDREIFIQHGDANDEIQKMCMKDWTNHRAVLFLDPYGMQVQWKTIEAIAKTRAVDLWILFPLGGVNRMLTQSGEMPPEWRFRLDELLGTTDWYERFYRIEASPSLFSEPIERVVKASIEVVSEYFLARLRECFAGVAPNPMVLRNSKNSPLYLFCFAAGNPNGSKVALKIASHILNWDCEYMANGSSIEWTESTWNPVTGCSKVSPGCKRCYAERMSKRLQAMSQPNYANGFELTIQEHMLELPLRWKKPQTIFVNSMSDLFHDGVPLAYIELVFDVMRRADWHRFQVLTKRADRLLELDPRLHWPANVWMGVSVECKGYLHRIDRLRNTGAHMKFLSLEPLLEDLGAFDLTGIDWVIVGGESGPGARPMGPTWARSLRDLCVDAKVPFFFKQWGGTRKKAAGRTLDGEIWNQMPDRKLDPLVQIQAVA